MLIKLRKISSSLDKQIIDEKYKGVISKYCYKNIQSYKKLKKKVYNCITNAYIITIMSDNSYIQRKQAEKKTKGQVKKFLEKWNENTPITILELLRPIKNYEDFNNILLLILQVVNKELIKWRIDCLYIGLYDLIVSMLVNHFITEWFECYNGNIQANESYQELVYSFDETEVPFILGVLEFEKEYPCEQPTGFYDFKEDFSIRLLKKLQENSIMQENPIMRETVERFKFAADYALACVILYTMARDIAIRNSLFLNNRIPYGPNMFVRNLGMFSWFYKMFAHAQQASSHTVKTESKINSSILNRIPSEIIDYMIKTYFSSI